MAKDLHTLDTTALSPDFSLCNVLVRTTPAAKAETQNRAVIAVLKRRAAQNQVLPPRPGGWISWLLATSMVLGTSGLALAQAAKTTGQTIRHHKVADEGEFPPEIRQAEDALDKKDYATAEKLLSTVTTRDAKSYRAWFDLGFLYNEQGRKDDSIAAYRKAVAAKPDVFESNLNLGLILARAGNPEAETFLRAATQLKPTDKVEEGLTRAWLSLAHVLETNKPEDAAGAYCEALKLQPGNGETHLALGALLERQNDEKAAEAEYEQALKLASPADTSSSSEAATALANLYMQGKRFPEAETMLRRLVAARPNDAVLHVQLGRVLAATGKYDEAASEMEAGLKLAPGDAGAVRDLADIYSLQKKNAEAEPLYQQLLTATPNDAELRHALGKSLLDQHKFPEAQTEFMEAVKLKPDFGGAYWDLAVAADQNKNYPLAISALDARTKFLPELPFGYFLRATAFDHLHDRKNAAVNYHKFLETANGKFPDQEWQARHRLIAIEPKK
jgi:Flp pilus assembly protein TadD